MEILVSPSCQSCDLGYEHMGGWGRCALLGLGEAGQPIASPLPHYLILEKTPHHCLQGNILTQRSQRLQEKAIETALKQESGKQLKCSIPLWISSHSTNSSLASPILRIWLHFAELQFSHQ